MRSSEKNSLMMKFHKVTVSKYQSIDETESKYCFQIDNGIKYSGSNMKHFVVMYQKISLKCIISVDMLCPEMSL